jgi:DNA modification methylase
LTPPQNQQMLKSHNKTVFETLGRNPIHPFPARMAAGIALEALGASDVQLRVLDPMVGSGTVLAVARAKGHCAIGVDLDPLAVLLAGVWTRSVDAQQVTEKAREVLGRAKHALKSMSVGRAYPRGGDDETRSFVRYWFDDYARRQLASLANSIGGVHDVTTREALWCGFSRLIITKSAGASLAMDLSHSRPHRKFERAPIKPFNRFLNAVETVVSNCPQDGDGASGPATLVKQGDARQLDIADESIDLVLTSPPYLNAIDYMRCSKFTLVWMGYGVRALRQIRAESVGSEVGLEEALSADWVQALFRHLRLRPALCTRDQALLARYAFDMNRVMSEVSRVLRRGGRAVYVIGDSMSKGTFIRNSAIVTTVAERHGLTLVSRQSRNLPPNRRYLPPPQRNESERAMDGRMRREVVVAFAKT